MPLTPALRMTAEFQFNLGCITRPWWQVRSGQVRAGKGRRVEGFCRAGVWRDKVNYTFRVTRNQLFERENMNKWQDGYQVIFSIHAHQLLCFTKSSLCDITLYSQDDGNVMRTQPCYEHTHMSIQLLKLPNTTPVTCNMYDMCGLWGWPEWLLKVTYD